MFREEFVAFLLRIMIAVWCNAFLREAFLLCFNYVSAPPTDSMELLQYVVASLFALYGTLLFDRFLERQMK